MAIVLVPIVVFALLVVLLFEGWPAIRRSVRFMIDWPRAVFSVLREYVQDLILGANQPHCEEEGCTSTDVIACYYPDNTDGTPDTYYCFDHIHDAGFCKGCGTFWAGIESFDFGNGYCDNCQSEMDNDDWYDDDLDFGWDDYAANWYDGSSLADLEDPDTPTHRYIGPGSEVESDR